MQTSITLDPCRKALGSWDSKTKKIKQWDFSDKGGFGEILWTPTEDGKKWLGNTTGIFENQPASCTIHRTIEESTYRDVITDFVVGPELLPSGSTVFTRQENE
ncbi:MAG: hypothetical protein JXB62_22955 [Pirellulales bacterium]|nr:hypothetical protein [Pirellulales bacterium]